MTININEMTDSWITLKTLNVLNEESVKKGYNRNLWMNIIEEKLKEGMDKSPSVKWNGSNTQVCLVPRMIHEHKSGKPCEPHVRCVLDTGGYIEGSNPTLDVSMEMFEKLSS